MLNSVSRACFHARTRRDTLYSAEETRDSATSLLGWANRHVWRISRWGDKFAPHSGLGVLVSAGAIK